MNSVIVRESHLPKNLAHYQEAMQSLDENLPKWLIIIESLHEFLAKVSRSGYADTAQHRHNLKLIEQFISFIGATRIGGKL